jgi:hypothetical protein
LLDPRAVMAGRLNMSIKGWRKLAPFYLYAAVVLSLCVKRSCACLDHPLA